jgi:hypothetical protein
MFYLTPLLSHKKNLIHPAADHSQKTVGRLSKIVGGPPSGRIVREIQGSIAATMCMDAQVS